MQSKRYPSLDDVCVLIADTDERDAIGNELPEDGAGREVFCAETPAASGEFYKAGQQGLRLEVVLVLDSTEYEGETRAKFGGQTLDIVRTYPRPDGMTELYLARKVGS